MHVDIYHTLILLFLRCHTFIGSFSHSPAILRPGQHGKPINGPYCLSKVGSSEGWYIMKDEWLKHFCWSDGNPMLFKTWLLVSLSLLVSVEMIELLQPAFPEAHQWSETGFLAETLPVLKPICTHMWTPPGSESLLLFRSKFFPMSLNYCYCCFCLYFKD